MKSVLEELEQRGGIVHEGLAAFIPWQIKHPWRGVETLSTHIDIDASDIVAPIMDFQAKELKIQWNWRENR